MATSRRPVNPSRRISESGTAPFQSSFRSRSASPPYLLIALLVLIVCILESPSVSVALISVDRCTFGTRTAARVEGDFSCTFEVQRTIPILKKAYGDSMHKVLHVGPDTCSVVSRLIREEDTEAWGVEPYDVEDADITCKRLVHRGLVRVADIKFPLPYRAKSFPLVIVSDSLDYLSPKYLNRTLPELARIAADGIVIFTVSPRHSPAPPCNHGIIHPCRHRLLTTHPTFSIPIRHLPSSKILYSLHNQNPQKLKEGEDGISETMKELQEGLVAAAIALPLSSLRRRLIYRFNKPMAMAGYPRHHKVRATDKAKYGRSAKLRSSTWWIRYFVQMSLEENEVAVKKFEQAAEKRSYSPGCQIFHLKSYN
ncbi:hypothetical protein BUALT_Bualt15G0120800 [Buddleja alternifolia]|uniref:Uncharacterized protein n=1 Tax=Buddleja alternifolia TaxID=168488 RepID=A0AAV6WGG9_9LAMI|nr:hypothetical protein BUALT_Bualt15G0120800 [Buddleja alternifolia]